MLPVGSNRPSISTPPLVVTAIPVFVVPIPTVLANTLLTEISGSKRRPVALPVTSPVIFPVTLPVIEPVNEASVPSVPF